MDYPVAICGANHGACCKVLDATGKHAAGCPTQFKQRYATHNGIVDVLYRAAIAAELTARRDPESSTLLEGKFSPSQVAVMFPKTKNPENTQRTAELQALVARRDQCCSTEERIDTMSEIEAFLTAPVRQGGGLRIDLVIEDNRRGPRWIDVTCRHGVLTGKEHEQLKFYKDNNEQTENLSLIHI